ncbi:MAG TPA: TolC family protein [Candidatus Acidoferrales bacterium]|nr:TolC family protein [Candidatus Acidoferrales bacterium]
MRSKVPRVWLVLALASLSGCAAQHYRAAPIHPAATAAALESRTLSDPGLQAYIEKGLGHRVSPWPPKSWNLPALTLAVFYFQPALDAARARVAEADAAIVTAGERPNPTLSLAPGVPSPYLFSLDLSIPLETAGKRGYRVAAARRLSDAAKLDLAAAAWAVRTGVRAALIACLLGQRQVQILQSQAMVQQEQVGELEQRLRAGEIARPEIDLARIALAKDRVAIRVARGRLAAARASLAAAVGVGADSLAGAVLSWPDFDSPPPVKSLSPQTIQHDATLDRLGVRRALADYAAAEARLQLEIARQYPDVSIGPGYSYEEQNSFFVIPFSIALPVFNRNQGPIAQAEARRREAAAVFRSTQAQVIAQSEQALTSYRSAMAELAETDGQLRVAQQGQLRLAEQSVRAGEQDRLALAGAQLETAVVAQARLDALGRAQAALGALEDAVERPLDPGDLVPVAPPPPASESPVTRGSGKG